MKRLIVAAGLLCCMQQPLAAERVVVGSKDFNEGYLLSEVVAQLLEHAGYEVERRFGLGGTLICYEALKHDEIDVYIEYTGTLSRAILKLDSTPPLPDLNAALAADDVEMLGGFGFDNTYALAMKATRADALGIRKISDIVHGHRDLKVVVSHEFLHRHYHDLSPCEHGPNSGSDGQGRALSHFIVGDHGGQTHSAACFRIRYCPPPA